MSPAESIPVRRICEVRPGADPVKRVAGYVKHTLHALSERRDSFIRVEPRKNFVSKFRGGVFCGISPESGRMGGQTCLNRHADIRRAADSGRSLPLPDWYDL